MTQRNRGRRSAIASTGCLIVIAGLAIGCRGVNLPLLPASSRPTVIEDRMASQSTVSDNGPVGAAAPSSDDPPTAAEISPTESADPRGDNIANAPVDQTAPTLSLAPATGAVTVGQTIDLEARIANASNLGAFEFTLTYNPAIVAFQRAAVGVFPGSTGRTIAIPQPAPLVNATVGRVSFGAYSYGAPNGPNGAGALARFTFRGVAAGSAPIGFSAERAFAIEITSPTGVVRPVGQNNPGATITVR